MLIVCIQQVRLTKDSNKAGPYYTSSKDLHSILKAITSQQQDSMKSVSVYIMKKSDIPLLQNSFYSLVTYGSAHQSILVVTTDRESFYQCQKMNFACFDGLELFGSLDFTSKKAIQPLVILEILRLGYAVHYSEG